MMLKIPPFEVVRQYKWRKHKCDCEKCQRLRDYAVRYQARRRAGVPARVPKNLGPDIIEAKLNAYWESIKI